MMIISFVICLILLQICGCEDICCSEVDFCLSGNPPFEHFHMGSCPSGQYHPSFTLYTSEGKDEGESMSFDVIPDTYLTGKPVLFIVHGYKSSATVDWVIEMKNEILDRHAFNVVAVNWDDLAAYIVYEYSAHLTPYVGAHIGKMINAVLARKGESTYVWCIGHSLGAHVCHFAGEKSTKTIDRISALDPAGPVFRGTMDRTIGVNPDSAVFVDVIHTDILFGNYRPLGHLDFFVNGGAAQPNCLFAMCSHSMAHTFFIQSIKEDCYRPSKICSDVNFLKTFPRRVIFCTICQPCPSMGWSAMKPDDSVGEPRMYYVPTSGTAPYCSIEDDEIPK